MIAFIQRSYLLVLALFAAGLFGLSLAFGLIGADDDDDDLEIDAPEGRTDAQINALMENIDEVIETTAFYSAFFIVLIILIVWAVAQGRREWALYSGLALFSLAWFAILEQNLSGLFWSGFAMSPDATIGAGFGLSAISALIAAICFDKQDAISLRIALVIFAVAMPILWFLSLSLGQDTQVYLVWTVFAASVLLHGIPPSRLDWFWAWARKNARIIPFGAITLLWAAIVFGEILEEPDPQFLRRILIGFVTTSFIALFFLRTITLLRERNEALRSSLEIAQKEVETSRALLDAEKRFSAARDLAQQRAQRLATASHDIRQPIIALRSTMAAAMVNETQQIKDQMNTAFDYLNDLAGTYIEEATDTESDTPRDERLNDMEIVSTTLVSETIDRMFRQEATAKGLAFENNMEDAQIHVDPLKLMRVVSNLVSNAIKHSTTGEVRLLGEPDQGAYRLAVSNTSDLPAEFDLEAAFDPHVKGQGSTGSGLGLSIVRDIAQEENLELKYTHADGIFRIELLIPRN